ncbi:MAG: hypothetical protein QXW32_02910 [Nitrososphaerales archaeon]
MSKLGFNNFASQGSAGKALKIYTYTALTILIFSSALTLIPTAYSAQATASFTLSDGLIKVEVTSPVEVHQFQLSITVPSGATINAAQASTTGFMEIAVFLQVGNEYRWFNLDAKPSKTGSLTVPASGVGVDNLPQLIRLDLLDANGNRIDLQQTLPLTATLAPITVTTTVRETITTTVTQTTTRTTTVTQPTTTTLTSTITQPTTITTTSTVTQPTTVTSTVTSTTTQPTTVTTTATTTATEVKTTTVTQTTTKTELATTTAYKEVPVDTTPYIVGIVILIVIIIILALLMLRRKAAV